MPNANDYFPSQFLKASDLKGRQVTVTIDRIEYEPVGREKTMKPVIYFVGKEKGMVMNRTNCNAIIKIAESPVTEDWSGVAVCLYAAMVEFQGDSVEAIRVKAPKTVATARLAKVVVPEPEPDEFGDDDAIPFAWLLPLVLPVMGLVSAGVLA